MRQRFELAEALLGRLEREEQRRMPEKELRNEDQRGGKIHHPGSAQSREVLMYVRDSETQSAESREATLRCEYEANRQRGSASSREAETRLKFEEERARQIVLTGLKS